MHETLDGANKIVFYANSYYMNEKSQIAKTICEFLILCLNDTMKYSEIIFIFSIPIDVNLLYSENFHDITSGFSICSFNIKFLETYGFVFQNNLLYEVLSS